MDLQHIKKLLPEFSLDKRMLEGLGINQTKVY
jgi:hypothetical protein